MNGGTAAAARAAALAGARKLVPVLALLVLAACGTPQKPASPATPAPQASASVAAPAQPASPLIDDDPARLISMDSAALTSLLGEPVRVRRDDSAEIRQFRSGNDCQLDTFLYPDGDVRRVSHVEIRHGIDRLAPAEARACLRRLIVARQTS